MNRNVGGYDRIVRGVLAIWLLATAGAAYGDGKRERAAIAAIAGVGLGWNALVGFCGGNWVLGVDTTDGSCAADGGT